MTLSKGRLLLVLNAGEATEKKLWSGSRDVVIEHCEVSRRRGTQASSLSVRFFDHGGKMWRDFDFGSKVKAYVDGSLVFYGVMVTPRYDVHGASVMVEFEAISRAYILYSTKVATSATYTGETTGTIAKAVIDAELSATFTTVGVTTATGVTLASFAVTAGESVGSVLERLTRYDGYTFDVDTGDDVRYYAVSAVSQLTITEDLLLGTSGSHMVEKGVQPPRNVVRVVGGQGYSAKTLQETQDAYYDLTSATAKVAQRFQASTARLSAFQLYLDRTTDPNQPEALSAEIQTEATVTHAISNTTLFDRSTLDSTLHRVAQPFTVPSVGPNVTLSSLSIYANNSSGSPGDLTISVQADSSGAPSGTALWSTSITSGVYAPGTYSPALTLTSGATYWIVFTPSAPADAANKWGIHYDSDLGDFSTRFYTSTDGGSTWSAFASAYSVRAEVSLDFAGPSGTRVEWSDDNSITAGDVAYPAAWSSEQSWGDPKLVLTEDDWYWLVLSDASATGTEYWRLGYDSGGQSSTVYGLQYTGSEWTALAGALTSRFFWSSAAVDVVAEDSASIASYGRWYHEESLPDVVTESEATTIANAILAAYSAPKTRMVLTMKDVYPSLDVNSVVTVQRPMLDIDDDFEVSEARIVYRSGRLHSVVVVGAGEFNVARAVEELRKKVT